jgi:hypothetical protein
MLTETPFDDNSAILLAVAKICRIIRTLFTMTNYLLV